MPSPHRVAIVGAGFGGLAVAKRLGGMPVEVTVVDRRNHHLFQPLLYQVATAGLNPSDIAYPIRSTLRSNPNTRVRLAEVHRVDPERRVVVLDGEELPYDHLVLACGATHSYFGHDEWSMHAPGLKTIEDALEIRRRLLSALEEAEQETDTDRRRALLSFVVVGAGATGVEMAGAITEIAFQAAARDFRRIDPTTAKVVLVEAADRVLSTYPPRLTARAEDQLRSLGVDVRTSVLVTGVDTGGVDTDRGRIDAATVIWAAGVAASPLARSLGSELDGAGRVIVEDDLSLPGHPEILVIGDMAHAETKGRLVPGVAPAALQAGRHAAAVIRADLDGRPRPTFRYRDKGSLATIGRSAAVAHIGPLQISGLPAWLLWWLVHLAYLVDFRSRLLVLFGWAWQYLTFQRGARLITQPWQPDRRPRPLGDGTNP